MGTGPSRRCHDLAFLLINNGIFGGQFDVYFENSCYDRISKNTDVTLFTKLDLMISVYAEGKILDLRGCRDGVSEQFIGVVVVYTSAELRS